MDIRIITKPITCAVAKEIAKEFYVDMVKGVVDTEREIIVLGGKWHIDANNKLFEEGEANQQAIWGFNLYPDKSGEDRLEYVALINIRPSVGNMDMYIEDPAIREKIRRIVGKLVL